MIKLKYWNPRYQIALVNWQHVFQFPAKKRMQQEVYRGSLYYQLRGSSQRISYKQLKSGLLRKDMGIINELLPF